MLTQTEKNLTDKKVFTTGEAAEVCRCSQQTIIRSFDSGRLTGFRVPGSRFRRIPRADLLQFMRVNHIPTDRIESQVRRVLVIDDDEKFVTQLEEALNRDDRFDVESASSGFDAGRLVAEFKPHLTLIGWGMPGINALTVCKRIKNNREFVDPKVLVILSRSVNEETLTAVNQAADEVIMTRHIESIVGRIGELLEV